MAATTLTTNTNPTTTTTNTTEEVPFRVLDRRRYSFFMIDNEVIDDYASRIGIYALGVYSVLARFSNQEGVCFPSLNTIAHRLGISKPSVIKALETLETYGLLAKEHRFNQKGDHTSNLYILLEVKKEPIMTISAEVVNEVAPGSKQHLPGGSQSHLPGGKRRLPEQNITYNNTQQEQDKQQQHKRKRRKKQQTTADNTVVVALIDLGISKKVAQYLAGQYNAERITEKIDYLAFLEEQYPEQVKNPCGWLRAAIIDDYGKPDGFAPQSEREQLAVEEKRRAQEETQQAQAVEEHQRSFQEEIQAEHEAAVLKLREEYETTEEDTAFWAAAQREMQTTQLPNMSALLADAEILRMKDDTVVIGVERKSDWLQLQHPGTQTAIKRALAYVAGQEVALEAVHCPGL
jgi:DNA-binding MarR family transcriptional regulator